MGVTICPEWGHERAGANLAALGSTQFKRCLSHLKWSSPAMHCPPLVEIGDKALVFGLRDCTVVGGVHSCLRNSPRRFERSPGGSVFPMHEPRSVLASTGGKLLPSRCHRHHDSLSMCTCPIE